MTDIYSMNLAELFLFLTGNNSGGGGGGGDTPAKFGSAVFGSAKFS